MKTGHEHKSAVSAQKLTTGIFHTPVPMRFLAALVLALILVAVLSITARAASQNITNVNIADKSDYVQITVAATMPISMNTVHVGSKYTAFDIYGRLLQKNRTDVKIGSGGIISVGYGWYKADPPVMRIAVRMQDKQKHSITFQNGKRRAIIRINKTSPIVTKEKAVKAESSAPVESQAGPSSAMSSPTVSAELIPPMTTRPVIEIRGDQISIQPVPGLANAPVLIASSEPIAVTSDVPAAASEPEALPKPVMVTAAAPVVKSSPKAVKAAPVVVEKAKPGPKVALDFVGSDIHDVIKALAMQTGTNIAVGADVKGLVTVSLKNVSVEEALKLITNLSGFKFAKVDGAYVVGTEETIRILQSSFASEEDGSTATAVIALKYADSNFVSKVLENNFPSIQMTQNVSSEEKEHSGPVFLVLTGNSGVVHAAKAMIESIEEKLKSSTASTTMELYEVKYADIHEVASLLTQCVPGLRVSIGPNNGFNLKCASPVVMGCDSSGGTETQQSTAPAKVLILEGTDEEMIKANTILQKVDVQQAQIIIEAKVLDISDDSAKELGIDWSWMPLQFGEYTRAADDVVTMVNAPINDVHIGRWDRNPAEMMTTLNALVESGKGRMIANPNVMAMDGKPASIFIGDEVKYVVNVQQTATGINVTVETSTVGIQLHSISRITSDGYITMNLHPEVSTISRWVDTPAGLSLPEISRRFVDSTICVKDGETIVIGGLIRDDEIEIMSGIPILKDLPFIGKLFQSKYKEKNHSEILMFITPKIIPSP